MDLTPESLRYIFGLKLRQQRQGRDLGLKELAQAAGMSVSYLSEIEKGRKYPKPEKILALADALGTSYDGLVSLEVDADLEPVRDLLASPFLRELPLHLYGIDPTGLLALLVDAPSKTRALLRTALEIGRLYDVRVEHVLFAALRSYQDLHQNYFEPIEDLAAQVVDAYGWRQPGQPTVEEVRRVLEEEHGYQVDEERLGKVPELAGLRAVWVGGKRPSLCVNPQLLPTQKAFQMVRELGYLRLGHSERSSTSSPIEVSSFDQVIHDFEAAYFAGAVLIDRDRLLADLEPFFARERWSGEAFLEIFHRHRSTPETFFYRLSQLLPRFFGLRESYFLRLGHDRSRDSFHLTKLLNMTQIPIGYGLDPSEHLCRRFAGVRLLRSLARHRAEKGEAGKPGAALAGDGEAMVTAQRSHFLGADRELFVFSMARPLALAQRTSSSVSLGFVLNRDLKRRIRFWNDAAIPQVEVDVTCERCPLSAAECAERAAPPRLVEEEAEKEQRSKALDLLVRELRESAAR